jgi:hypothetical protein
MFLKASNFQLQTSTSLWEEFCALDSEKDYISYKRFLLQYADRLKQEMEAFNLYFQNLESQSTYQWYLFDLLCGLGMVLAFCSGFDGMVSVITMVMPQLFLGFAIALGVISAICALGIFLARDKLSIAEALGLELETTADQVDIYLFKLQRFYHAESQRKLHEQDHQDLNELYQEYQAVEKILEGKQLANQSRMEDMDVNIQSGAVMLIGGIIMFSDGFFVGQSVGMFVASLLVSHMFALTLTLGLVVGLCGLASYLYVERPSLSKFLYGVIFTNQEETEERLTKTQEDVRILRFGVSN